MKNYKKTEHFEAIAMKCTEEQFNKLKPILDKYIEDIKYSGSGFQFKTYPYITNYSCEEQNRFNTRPIEFLHSSVKIIETFNAEIFLKACGIVEVEKTPSLEELKERFKNAKKVKCCLNGEIKKLTHKSNCLGNNYIAKRNNGNQFWMTAGNDYNALVYDDGKYAEIISYKEKTYQLSETFVKELCKEPNIKEAFIREGIIDETIEIKKSLILNTPNDLELGQLIRKMI